LVDGKPIYTPWLVACLYIKKKKDFAGIDRNNIQIYRCLKCRVTSNAAI